MYKQFIYFLIDGIFIAVFELIDTAFSNNINIDTIVATSSYMLITWVTYCIYSIGSYGYRVINKNEKLCLLVNMFTSIIPCIILVLFRRKIVLLYGLTENQNEILSSAIFVHAVGLPFRAIGEFLSQYLKIKKLNKLMFISNIVYYAQMIIGNSIALLINRSLSSLLVSTNLCWIVYCIIILCFSGLFKEKCEYNIKSLLEILKHGGLVVLDKVFGKVATVTYVVFASKLDTIQYAIHSISFEVAVSTEYLTEGVHYSQLTTLNNCRLNINNKIKLINQCMKKIYPITLLAGYIFAIIMTIVIKGEIGLISVIPFVCIYTLQIISQVYYQSYRALIMNTGNTNIMVFNGIIGILVRVPVTLISYYTPIGLFGFGLASFLDYGVRGILMKRRISKTICKQ